MIRTNDNSPVRVGLIGIGLVGTALAENLLANDVDIVGYDIDAGRLDHLRQLGGTCAASPQEVAGSVTHVILSLPDTTVVQEVIEGSHGILEAPTPPSYVIDTSTGDPEDTLRLAQELQRHRIAFLDATIGGASSQLKDRDVLLMVGGTPSAFAACEQLLYLMANRVFHVGPSGSGSKAKLATNLVLGLNRLALAEGIVFAERLGLSPEAFVELVRVGPAYSAAVDVKGRKMLDSDFATSLSTCIEEAFPDDHTATIPPS